MLFKRYIHDKNGGSLALTRTLNDYFDIVVREVYCNDGDILKFSGKEISFEIECINKCYFARLFYKAVINRKYY